MSLQHPLTELWDTLHNNIIYIAIFIYIKMCFNTYWVLHSIFRDLTLHNGFDATHQNCWKHYLMHCV